jgi:beta-glucosidase
MRLPWAIKARCDSDDVQFEINIPLAVKSGRPQIADVDRALARVLRVGFRRGAFDSPELNPYSKVSADVIRSEGHRRLSLQTALESMTLLTKRNNFLLLKRKDVRGLL